MGVPVQVYQQPGLVNLPQRPADQASIQGIYPPPLSRYVRFFSLVIEQCLVIICDAITYNMVLNNISVLL
jgi:hypothetical protein